MPYTYKYISWRSSIFFSCQLTAQRRRIKRVKNSNISMYERKENNAVTDKLSIYTKVCLLAFNFRQLCIHTNTVMHVMSRISLFYCDLGYFYTLNTNKRRVKLKGTSRYLILNNFLILRQK